uniref:Uncharacterized protein n=1 Tax=Physcomitrium patens TaxID=3218 RepID=A0A2K1JVF4_PHYPA|nr:hypothetical protein PHYPA_015279 [Physcomitrium patens]
MSGDRTMAAGVVGIRISHRLFLQPWSSARKGDQQLMEGRCRNESRRSASV